MSGQEPSPKPEGIKRVLKGITGRDHDQCIREGICTYCGGEAKTFRNAISRRENQISGFCQQCQDRTFGKD